MFLTRRETLIAALAAGMLPHVALAQETAKTAPVASSSDPRVGDRVMGSPDAPVTFVEYAMFTCPHCAAFNAEVFPKIKANYIDTGKVKLVYREVYFNKPSLWAGMLARCAPQERYFGIADVLFERQKTWAGAESQDEMVKQLFAIGRQAGMTDDQMNACLQDRGLAEGLVADYQAKAGADKVDGTPTFFINGVEQPNASYEEIAAKLDAALGS